MKLILKDHYLLSGFLMCACVLFAQNALACLNAVGTDRDGKLVHGPGDHDANGLKQHLSSKPNVKDLISRARERIKTAKEKPSYGAINDLAVSLITLGDYKNAIKHLLLVEKKSPGEYETATNLGTAYELAGNNAQALYWIKEGIRRNPDSHYGSEWLHVKILEAKISDNADSIFKGSILKLDGGSGELPLKPKKLPLGNNGKPVSLYRLASAIEYQMLERTQFVNAPDPVVASLMFDWANLQLAAGTMEYAEIAYDVALTYGHPNQALIKQRHAKAQKRLRFSGVKKSLNDLGLLGTSDGNCELCFDPEQPEGPEVTK
jgi:tetratricopeptide (TPR) repeat protein